MSRSQGRDLVVSFNQHDSKGYGLSSSSFPFVCHPSQSLERDTHTQREDEDEESGGRAGHFCCVLRSSDTARFRL